jgi:hypothetical protein
LDGLELGHFFSTNFLGKARNQTQSPPKHKASEILHTCWAAGRRDSGQLGLQSGLFNPSVAKRSRHKAPVMLPQPSNA